MASGEGQREENEDSNPVEEPERSFLEIRK